MPRLINIQLFKVDSYVIFALCADKPPIEELHQFLDFQLPRQWAPVFGELALGPQKKPQSSASLQFSFMGPKLYVNTNPVMLLLLCFPLKYQKLCCSGYIFHGLKPMKESSTFGH